MSTSKLQLFRCFLTERLTAAAVEIFGEVESVVEEFREENQRLQQMLSMLRPEIKLHRADGRFFTSPIIEQSSAQSTSLTGEIPEHCLVRIKEEQEEHLTSPGGEGAAAMDFILTPALVKIDEDQDLSLPHVSMAFRVIKVESNDDSQSTVSVADMASAADMASDNEGGTHNELDAPSDLAQPSSQKKGKKCSRCEECGKSLKRKIPETIPVLQKTGSKTEKQQQTTIPNLLSLGSKYHPDAKEQQTKERALALWIGRTGLPARTVEDKDFLKMMEVVDRRLAIPKKTKISNLIESIYKDERKTFKDRLAAARKITIGLDIWTTEGLSASFLAISACYFCTVQNQPEHILLSLKQISHPHTANSIKACVDQCTEMWGIPENKILTVITGNGSNMAAAFKPPEEEEPSSSEDSEEERSEGEQEKEEETRYGGMERTPCFVHTLQLVVNMIHKEVSVTRLLEKVKAVVKQFRSSSVAMEKLHQLCGLTLIKDCMTRWSSTFQMVSRLLQVKDSVAQVSDEMGWDCLLPSEWIKMTAVRDLLLPFADHTKTLQSDTMSLSLIVPALLDLITHLSQFSLESAHRDLHGLADKMKDNLEQRFSCFLIPSEAKFSPLAAAACFLDPTVAGDALIENTDDDGIQELLNEAETFILSATATTSTTQREDEMDKDDGDVSMKGVEQNEVPSSKRPRFRFLSSKLSKPPKASNAQQEMRKYKKELSSQQISDFEHGMDFWLAQNSMTYVTLKPLALDLLAMPASQAFVERVFSITGDLTRARHNRARVILERSAFLRLNRDDG